MDELQPNRLWQAVAPKLLHFAAAFGVALLVFAAVLAAGWFVGRLLERAAGRQVAHAALLTILARAARVGAIVIGGLTAFENLGGNVTAFVTSLGLLGLTLGFALRDIVSSFVAGLMIIVYRPFQPGDRIAVQSVEGRVQSIELRYTVLVGDGRLHLVPNSILLSNPVSVIRATPPGAPPAD